MPGEVRTDRDESAYPRLPVFQNDFDSVNPNSRGLTMLKLFLNSDGLM